MEPTAVPLSPKTVAPSVTGSHAPGLAWSMRLATREEKGSRHARAVAFRPMVAGMAEFTGPVTQIAEIARIAGEALEGWLRDVDGYLGLVMLTDEESHTARVMTFWESAEAEARSRSTRQTMREQLAGTAGLDVVDYRVWEVPVWEILAAASPR